MTKDTALEQKKNISENMLPNFPQELINYHLGPELDIQTLDAVKLVSKQWHTLFNRPEIWQNKIIKDHQISAAALRAFSNLLPNGFDLARFYKTIYLNLSKLKQQEQLMIKPVYQSYVARDQQNTLYLLASCTDDPAVFTQVIPLEERYVWLQIALYTGAGDIFKTLIKDPTSNFKPFMADGLKQEDLWFAMASRAANKIAMAFLLDQKNGFNFINLRNQLGNAINSAIHANNASLFMMLNKRFETEFNQSFLFTEYQITSDIIEAFLGDVSLLKTVVANKIAKGEDIQDLFNLSLFSKNPAVIGYFLDPDNHLNLNFDSGVLLAAIYISYMSSNNEAIFQILAAMNQEQIVALGEPSPHGLLYYAVYHGDLRLFKLLIENLEIKPDQEIFDVARDPTILSYLLNPKYEFGFTTKSLTFDTPQPNINASFSIISKAFDIKPTQKILNDVAAHSLVDLQFILDKTNGFNLKPNEETLLSALRGGNLPAVRFLLDPRQQFKLKLDEAGIASVLNSNDINAIPFLADEEQYFPLVSVITQAIVDVMRSEMALQTAVENLQQKNYAAAHAAFDKASSFSENHTKQYLDYIRQNPQHYDLSQADQLDFLQTYQISCKNTSPTTWLGAS